MLMPQLSYTASHRLKYVCCCKQYFGAKYDLDRSTMHPRFELTGFKPQVHDSTFHVPEMLVPTTWPLMTLNAACLLHKQNSVNS